MHRRMWFSLFIIVVILLTAAPGAVAQSPEPPQPPDPGRSGEGGSTVIVPQAVQGGGSPWTFTYQGQIKKNGSPYSGMCDMEFRVHDSGGIQIGSTATRTLSVSAGLFTTHLDFGQDAFNADERWLNIRVRCPAGSGSYTTLSPDQWLTPTPYALTLRPPATISATLTSDNVLNVYNYADYRSFYAYNLSDNWATVRAENVGAGFALYGTSTNGTGVWGEHLNTTGDDPAIRGRTYSTASATNGVLGELLPTAPGGLSAGVKGLSYGTGYNGIGVFAESHGKGVGAPALYALNTATGAEPSGIAIFAKNNSGDATIVAQNTYTTGDTFRSINAAGNSVIFRVTSTGRVVASAVQIYGGGDVAERFQVQDKVAVEPGTLMIIDDENPGKLKPSDRAYDSRVAGVVSGAGGVNPGLTLYQQDVMEGDAVVAITGRVYVKADASNGPIKPGDLLTTSGKPGYAMKATDRAQAQGAIIGKAMTGLDQGTGLVLVLISLQ